MKKFLSFLLPVLICFGLGFIASRFQTDALENWYPYLNKPQSTPPDSVFPIAWSILYLCMGISIGLILNSESPRRQSLIILFAVQLVLNFLWSILFFYFQQPLWGLIDILLLLASIVLYAIKAYPASKTASFLFLPYILWVGFATWLNLYIFLYN